MFFVWKVERTMISSNFSFNREKSFAIITIVIHSLDHLEINPSAVVRKKEISYLTDWRNLVHWLIKLFAIATINLSSFLFRCCRGTGSFHPYRIIFSFSFFYCAILFVWNRLESLMFLFKQNFNSIGSNKRIKRNGFLRN